MIDTPEDIDCQVKPPAAGASPLEFAHWWASRGFAMHPLKRGAKEPHLLAWQHLATADQGQIDRWAAEFPRCNWGIHTKGLLVLDVDVKHGQRGAESLEKLDLLYGTPDWLDTERIHTPSGGTHLVFTCDVPVKNDGKGRIGPGIDVRSCGGFVVAAGSIFEGKRYEHLGGVPKPAPDWLVELAGRPRERAPREEVDAETLDLQPNLDWTAAYLREQAETASLGRRGSTAYHIACCVRDRGITESMCLNLMFEHWNVNGRCDPPMEPEELETSVRNSYTYATNNIGSRNAAADFDPISEEEQAEIEIQMQKAPDRPPLPIILAGDVDITAQLAKVPLVDEWLDQGAMSVLYGDSNVGKSFVVFDLAWHVALGKTWFGKRTEQGAVVYIAAEASDSAMKRIAALKMARGVRNYPLALVPRPVDLRRANGDTSRVIDAVRSVEQQLGEKVKLVVIDTLARAIAGGNENSPEDMGALVQNLDRIRGAVSAHLLVVHHTGKDAAKGARGHSSLRAATDTEIEVTEGRVSITKQRDMEKAPPRARLGCYRQTV